MYPSDMVNAQWQVLAKHFAEMNKRGRPRVRSAQDMPARFACRKVLLHNLPPLIGHVTWIHDDSLPHIQSLRTASKIRRVKNRL